MSASSQLRLAGFNALLGVAGEALKSGNLTIQALVNRRTTKVKDGVSARDGKLDFSVMGMTEIEFLFGSLIPAAGNTFLDGIGFRHRIMYVTNSDITWVCYCSQSAA